jgi:hypothetical protein
VLLTEPPTTWPNPPPFSFLQVLLVFVGIPLLITAGIVLLVMLPSLAKSSRYGPEQPGDAQSEWFGSSQPPLALEQGRPEGRQQPQLTGSTRASGPDDETGGASVRW